MKPYYRKAGITIYHADCREVLPTLPKVDLVLTDPPYGMKYKSGYYKAGNPFGPITGDAAFPLEVLQACFGMARVAVLAFCRWNNLAALPEPKSFIVWAKNNHTAGDLKHAYGRKWEGIAFYPQAGHAFKNGRPTDIIDFRRVASIDLNHPTEKPVGLCELLMEQHAGTSVLDPYAGSGTTLLAARNLNRQAIGIEIEEKYCEIAAKRLDAALPGPRPLAPGPSLTGPRSLAA